MAQKLEGDDKDLGGVTVTRLLPHVQKKMVGPFIFFDHIGPAEFAAGRGVNVRPHPHIGLATLTYLFDGSLLHRDSLGSVQEISPGDVNWMVAGHGIVHSERETHEVRGRAHSLHGLQLWVALPPARQGMAPAFTHINKHELPCRYLPGLMVRVVVGAAYGVESPVETYSPMIFLDVIAEAGAVLARPHANHELAIFTISGGIEIDGDAYYQGDFVLLDQTDQAVRAIGNSRYVVIGGEKCLKPPMINWNFVAYERESIEAARQRWENGAFPAIPGDDEEFIPLP